METGPFAFEAPSESSPAVQPPFSSIFTSFLPDTSSSTLSTLSKLSLALLEHRIETEVGKELESLRGELRTEYRPRLKAVKADFMARMVWNDDTQAQKYGEEQKTESTETEGEEEVEEKRFDHPTITSDSDAQAEMSANLDVQAEEGIERSLQEAKDRIERGVRATKAMELEIWLSQTILDAYEMSAGEEIGAARFVQEQLEDSLFEAGLDTVSVLQALSSSA
ncbi:hypothetical protein JCM5350_002235 [Sporobolomyces pararoseus]